MHSYNNLQQSSAGGSGGGSRLQLQQQSTNAALHNGVNNANNNSNSGSGNCANAYYSNVGGGTAQQNSQYYAQAAVGGGGSHQTTGISGNPYQSFNNQNVPLNPTASSSYLQPGASSPDSSSNYMNPQAQQQSQQQQMAYSASRYNAYIHSGRSDQPQTSVYAAYTTNASTPCGAGGGAGVGAGGTVAGGPNNYLQQQSAYSCLSSADSAGAAQQQQGGHYSSYGNSYSSLSQLNPTATAAAASHLDTFGVDTTSLHRGMLSAFRSASGDQYGSNNASLQQYQHSGGYGNHLPLAASSTNAQQQQQVVGDASGLLSNPYALNPPNTCIGSISYANIVAAGANSAQDGSAPRSGVGGLGAGAGAAAVGGGGSSGVLNCNAVGGASGRGGPGGTDYDGSMLSAIGGSGIGGVVLSMGKKEEITLGDKMILEKLEKLEAEILQKLKKVSIIQPTMLNSASSSISCPGSSSNGVIGMSMSSSTHMVSVPVAKKALTKAEELKKLASGQPVTVTVDGAPSVVKTSPSTAVGIKDDKQVEIIKEYDFREAVAFTNISQKKCILKVLAGHGVVGSFFGANGHRVQALQQEYEVTVSVTTKRIHFPGSNNKGVLLFQGKLINILRSLRPLFRAMQEEIIRLFLEDASKIKPESIKLEVEVVVPESLRFKMDRQREFRQLMEQTGSNIRVIKQTYEDGFVQERVLVIFGRRIEVEMAIERISILIQEDANLKNYQYMKYPDLTVAFSVAAFSGGGMNYEGYGNGGGGMGGGMISGVASCRNGGSGDGGNNRILCGMDGSNIGMERNFINERRNDRWTDRGGGGSGSGNSAGGNSIDRVDRTVIGIDNRSGNVTGVGSSHHHTNHNVTNSNSSANSGTTVLNTNNHIAALSSGGHSSNRDEERGIKRRPGAGNPTTVTNPSGGGGGSGGGGSGGVTIGGPVPDTDGKQVHRRNLSFDHKSYDRIPGNRETRTANANGNVSRRDA